MLFLPHARGRSGDRGTHGCLAVPRRNDSLTARGSAELASAVNCQGVVPDEQVGTGGRVAHGRAATASVCAGRRTARPSDGAQPGAGPRAGWTIGAMATLHTEEGPMRCVLVEGGSIGRALALAAAAALVACGGHGGGTAGGAPDGSVVVASSGDGGTASSPDGGGPPDGGSVAGGDNGGGTAGGGTVPGSGGTTAGGSGGPSGGGSPGVDAGPEGSGGGGAGGGSTSGASGCAGLLATPGPAVELKFDTGTHTACELATSNPNGQVDLGISGGSFSTEVVFRIYSSDGTAAQGTIPLVVQTVRRDIDPWFHWTSAGYVGIVHDPPPPQGLRTWSGTGTVFNNLLEYVDWTAPTPDGGSVILARTFDPNATPGVGPPLLQWLTGGGSIVRSVTLDDAAVMMVLVAWPTAHVLVLVPAGLRARWFDGAGTALTPWFDAGAAVDPFETSMPLLVDGSVALADGQGWRTLFRDGAARADPPPRWLADRPGTRLATIRQGRAYAVVPSPASGGTQSDQGKIEIVTTAGESCGSITIPDASPTAGVT